MNDRQDTTDADGERPARRDFIRSMIEEDLAAGRNGGVVQTRFPPEPNGYLHIGHGKAIALNFAIAREYGGRCNLRFDDTNPAAEEDEFVEAIQEDIRWLGYRWDGEVRFTSSYFETLYRWAEGLIRKGVAYVCDLSPEETRQMRGTITSPGQNSPYRDRTPEENLELFRRMRAGEFEDGACTLRAKIDMASPNLNLRDPVLYRILRARHHRTGDAWCIYPMYDWAHGQSDAIEGVTHSLCSLEFENHRPLYDWFLDHIDLEPGAPRPRQTEFARLNLTYTVLAKRQLRRLVEEGHVSGWDDPRMPTIRGLRRRGYTPTAVRTFLEGVGVAKFNSTVDMVVLENALREEQNRLAERRMAVLRPIELVIENYPEDGEEFLEAHNNPEDEGAGTREVPFSRTLFIERSDFRESAPRKYHRLAPGKEVRLRYAYYVTCTGFDTDPETGEVVRVRCTYDPETRGGDSADGRKVRGTIHWVSARHAFTAPVRLYDHLFSVPNPMDVPEGGDLLDHLNPASLEVLENAKLEPALRELAPGTLVQFERHGYFCLDTVDSSPGSPVFHRAVALRDSWAKLEKKLGAKPSGSGGAP
ncbi:MAG TPA: glutamine--tRNA ligase/YqeY domain fusion protein [Planctomycetes bacterium]|nr:glutamine--tRNA ligase/YqeY domain fusion protein [Planctomycetota bacterium]